MIPFFKTTFGEEEKKAICDTIDSGWVVMGKKTQEFEEKFAEYVGSKYAVFVDSCTAALFLAVKCIEQDPHILPGEYWEVPSLTFVSTAESVVNAGYKPKFVDVIWKDGEPQVASKKHFDIKNTKAQAINVALTGTMLYGGISPLVIDSAHLIEKDAVKHYPDALWCHSFYATKNMSTVQGGMIALNNEEQYKWLKAARDHGISKGTLERYTQKTPTYSIDFVGYRFKADDVRAAIGLEQLKKLPEMTRRRNEIVQKYNSRLGLSRSGNHLYPILVSDREKFFNAMEVAGIQCSVHFLPLHKMPAFKKYCDYSLPNTEYLGERLVSLPLFPDMTDEQVDYIADKVLETNLLIQE